MSEPVDWRNLRTGLEIPSQNYSDQPYIVKTSDGAWLCTMTTGLGYEGEAGQHVVTMRSTDRGRTWSEPEIVLYSDAPLRGPSYPDFVEDGGHSFISATRKTEARIAEVDPALLNALWTQHETGTVAHAGLVLELDQQAMGAGQTVPAPVLPPLSGFSGRDRELALCERGGFSLDLWVRFDALTAGQILLDGRDVTGKGIVLATTDRRTLRLDLCDG